MQESDGGQINDNYGQVHASCSESPAPLCLRSHVNAEHETFATSRPNFLSGCSHSRTVPDISAALLPPSISADDQRDKGDDADGDEVLVFLDVGFVATQKIAEQGQHQ